MPATVKRDISKNLMIITAEGDLLVEDILGMIESLFEESDTPQKRLWDLRKARLHRIPSSEVRTIVEVVKKYTEDREEGKAALVVETDSDYGILRMYEGYASHLPVKMGVFRSLDEALEWLSGTS